jgi:hypothetical protein
MLSREEPLSAIQSQALAQAANAEIDPALRTLSSFRRQFRSFDRRIERTGEDSWPTLIILDEAWKLLDDPYFEHRLKDWMLTNARWCCSPNGSPTSARPVARSSSPQ